MAAKPGQLRDFAPDDIEFVLKDPNSAGGECHSFHRVPGGYVANGNPVSERTASALQHRGPGEVAVFINDDTLDALMAARVAEGE